VQRAGFDGVWSSGLEISASHCVPDANILSMSDFLAATADMTRAVSLPVIADCDTGYGDANNVRYAVERHEACGAAAICIEDKTFPKRNSFDTGPHTLVSIAEFSGKVLAAKSAQRDPDTFVLARTEALIAGLGLSEALRRAAAYADAGADAVLVHDRGADPRTLFSFAERWRRETPLVVVPTTFHVVTASQLESAGIKMVIYANQGLRASIAAVSSVLARILADDGTTKVEDCIAPISEVLDLQGFPELRRNERLFGAVPLESRRSAVGD